MKTLEALQPIIMLIIILGIIIALIFFVKRVVERLYLKTIEKTMSNRPKPDFKISATAIACYMIILSMFLPWKTWITDFWAGISGIEFIQTTSGLNLYYIFPFIAVLILILGFINYERNRLFINILRLIPLPFFVYLTLGLLDHLISDTDSTFSYGYLLLFIGCISLVLFYEKKQESHSTIIRPEMSSKLDLKFCINCGAPLEARFCRECGQDSQAV